MHLVKILSHLGWEFKGAEEFFPERISSSAKFDFNSLVVRTEAKIIWITIIWGVYLEMKSQEGIILDSELLIEQHFMLR